MKLHVEVVGEGPPVVVLHGLFGAGRNWLSVARRLSASFCFHLVDLRNHGRSPHHPEMNYTAMAADVAAVIEAVGAGGVTLVGHSMGGKAAMTLALNQPALVQRVIAVDIAPVTYPDRFADMIDAMLAIDLGAIRRRNEADALLEEAIPEKSVRQFVLQNLMFENGAARWRANLPVLRDQMPAILGPLPVAAGARADCETVFIRGALSDRIGPQERAVIDTLFSNYRIDDVAGGGHWPHAEAPQEFMRLFCQALGTAVPG